MHAIIIRTLDEKIMGIFQKTLKVLMKIQLKKFVLLFFENLLLKNRAFGNFPAFPGLGVGLPGR